LIQRFSQALLNNERAEVSNKSLSAELEELRVSFSRLSTEHARSVGWEARLHKAMQETDDFRQERDAEAQKLRAAETKLASLSDKCGEPCLFHQHSTLLTSHKAKLSLEVRLLQERLEEERVRYGQTAEEIIHEAKQWLGEPRHSVGFCVAIP
jgi:hypothetical protein